MIYAMRDLHDVLSGFIGDYIQAYPLELRDEFFHINEQSLNQHALYALRVRFYRDQFKEIKKVKTVLQSLIDLYRFRDSDALLLSERMSKNQKKHLYFELKSVSEKTLLLPYSPYLNAIVLDQLLLTGHPEDMVCLDTYNKCMLRVLSSNQYQLATSMAKTLPLKIDRFLLDSLGRNLYWEFDRQYGQKPAKLAGTSVFNMSAVGLEDLNENPEVSDEGFVRSAMDVVTCWLTLLDDSYDEVKANTSTEGSAQLDKKKHDIEAKLSNIQAMLDPYMFSNHVVESAPRLNEGVRENVRSILMDLKQSYSLLNKDNGDEVAIWVDEFISDSLMEVNKADRKF